MTASDMGAAWSPACHCHCRHFDNTLTAAQLRRTPDHEDLHAAPHAFLQALAGDTPAVIGAGLEELFRFVPSLRPEGVAMVVDMCRGICILGGEQGRRCRRAGGSRSHHSEQRPLAQDPNKATVGDHTVYTPRTQPEAP